MAEVQVTCIGKQDAIGPREQVTHLGNIEAGWLWTRDDVIASIEAKINRFFVVEPNTGRCSWVGVARLDDGAAHLCAYAKGIWNDDLSSLPRVLAFCVDEQNHAGFPQPVAQQEGLSPAGWLLLGSAAALVVAALCDDGTETEKACGICRRLGHNRSTCPYGAARINFSRTIPKSRRCECCGQYGYPIKRHHPRGRGDSSDFLDMCDDCHVTCGHGGHFQNLARKPLNCRILNCPSAWRS